jgi:hypothetical protein
MTDCLPLHMCGLISSCNQLVAGEVHVATDAPVVYTCTCRAARSVARTIQKYIISETCLP